MTFGCRFSQALFLAAIVVSTVGERAWCGEAPVTDIADKLHLIYVGEAYKVGTKYLVCVEDATHRKFLLDPTEEGPASPPPAGCRPPEHARFANALVDFPPAEGAKPVRNDTSFASGATIIAQSVLATHCGPTLPMYYTVTYPNGASYSFYVVTRLKQARTVTLDAGCDTANGKEIATEMSFDEIATLSSFDLGNGMTLLSGYGEGAYEPVLLLVRTVPQSLWSSGGNVFLVPQTVLGPALEKAGYDVAKRNDALLRAIGQ